MKLPSVKSNPKPFDELLVGAERTEARILLVAAALTGTDVQTIRDDDEIRAIAQRAVKLADAALAEVER